MPRPRLRTVILDEFQITRNGDYAVFRYVDPEMGGGMSVGGAPVISNHGPGARPTRHEES